MVEVKVVDSVGNLMFSAKLNDSWLHILTMRNKIEPFIKSVNPVKPGTGNGGKNKEYDVVYDGYYVSWEHFAAVGNEAN